MCETEKSLFISNKEDESKYQVWTDQNSLGTRIDPIYSTVHIAHLVDPSK